MRITLTLLALLPMAANAADESAAAVVETMEDSGPQDIVVTATRDRRSAFSTPASITRIDDESIADIASKHQADVLNRIAEGLMLTEPEREHLFMIGLGHPPEVHFKPTEGVSPRLQRVLDAFEVGPAIIKNALWDVVAWNRAAAVLLKRPVKWIESRSENLLATNHGRNQWSEFEAGADATGKITALKARVLLDSGAYPKALDLAWATWIMATGPYDIPNLDYEVLGAYTNTMANGAYRGAGRPEAAYYLERVVDLIADEGGLDPVEVRRINFIKPDQFPFTTLTGEHYDTGEHEKALNKALEVADYVGLRKEQAEALKQGRHLGIGIASYVEICGFGPYDSTKVRIEPSGDVSIFTGISPHGQGQETTFAQMAQQHIGADFERTVVHHGDTSTNPQGNGTMGSRGLPVGGAALMMSLNKIKDKATRIAAHMLEAAVEDIEVVDGKYQVKGVPDRGVGLGDIAEKAYSGDLPDEIEPGLEPGQRGEANRLGDGVPRGVIRHEIEPPARFRDRRDRNRRAPSRHE